MSGARIVVVEDEWVIADDLRGRLEKQGHAVVGVFSRGEQAVEAVRADPPDLVMMDIMLAGEMDGVEAAAAIHECCEVPLIFLTGWNPVRLVVIGGLVQSLVLPAIGFSALYLRFRLTDERLRPGRLWDAALILSCLSLLTVGIFSLTRIAAG